MLGKWLTPKSSGGLLGGQTDLQQACVRNAQQKDRKMALPIASHAYISCDYQFRATGAQQLLMGRSK